MSLETLILPYDLNNPQGYLKVAVLEGIMQRSLSLGLLLLEGKLSPGWATSCQKEFEDLEQRHICISRNSLRILHG